MNKKTKTSRTFTRRAFVIGGLQGAFLSVLGARLAWLQLAQGQRYQTLSDQNRINLKILPPSRGEIVDRFGVPLAINSRNFRLLIIPEQTENLPRLLEDLRRLVEIDDRAVESALKQAKKAAKFMPIEIRDNLSWEDVARVEVNLPDLPGVSIDIGETRNYPFREGTAHLIGYVGLPAKTETGADPLLSLPGFKIGKTGIEKAMEEILRGHSGTSEVEVNVIGREIRELQRNDPSAGGRVELTIDAELQRFAQQRIAEERSASAVIMDIHTGALYSMVSHPSFDPHIFSQGLSAEMWEELLADPGYPLTNKALSGQYPPASTFKMVTSLAGLESGAIDIHRRVYCPGHYKYGKDKFHCWKKGGHGSVNVVEALEGSCDVYFYDLAKEIGIEKIAQTARKLGLGQKYGFILSEEREGLIPDQNWKTGYYGQSWTPGETIVAGIGQGYLQATPMQLAVMVSRLVNGGRAVKPWIIKAAGKNENPVPVWPKFEIDKAYADIIGEGMQRVVNDERGTAYASRIKESSMAMGGKTGTAQVQRITKAQRSAGIKNEELPWAQRHHALFVGYAPLDRPRYACCVVVEHGIGGSSSAAPLARDLLLETQRRDPARLKYPG
ncbi:MAG: penicillin-binding protein 2 [Alphaproteobacteria bacterium]|nr:penicillin-binding protein 2 [Alphaproteobacteria bacterium]